MYWSQSLLKCSDLETSSRCWAFTFTARLLAPRPLWQMLSHHCGEIMIVFWILVLTPRRCQFWFQFWLIWCWWWISPDDINPLFSPTTRQVPRLTCNKWVGETDYPTSGGPHHHHHPHQWGAHHLPQRLPQCNGSIVFTHRSKPQTSTIRTTALHLLQWSRDWLK